MWQHIAKQGTSSSTSIIHFYFPWILLKENCVHFLKFYIKIDQTLSLQVIKVGGTCFLVFFQMVGTEPISSYHKLVQRLNSILDGLKLAYILGKFYLVLKGGPNPKV